ncbi:MAG: hypothetical protein AAFN10_07585 [Bacteroidota bacterium]
MDAHSLKVIKYLTLPLLLLLGLEAYWGAFSSGTYQAEVASRTQQLGFLDRLNLFVVLPLLGLSLWQIHRHKAVWILSFGGLVFYSLYQGFLYAFGLHFNRLFLLYCLHLGLSFYLFVYFIRKAARLEISDLFRENAPLKLIGGFLILAALLFYTLWLTELIPALRNASLPRSVAAHSLLVNPRHVLDLGIVLPSMLVAGILLIRRHGMGYLVSGIFLIYLCLQLSAMIGTEQSPMMGYTCGGLVVLSGFCFWRLVRFS